MEVSSRLLGRSLELRRGHEYTPTAKISAQDDPRPSQSRMVLRDRDRMYQTTHQSKKKTMNVLFRSATHHNPNTPLGTMNHTFHWNNPQSSGRITRENIHDNDISWDEPTSTSATYIPYYKTLTISEHICPSLKSRKLLPQTPQLSKSMELSELSRRKHLFVKAEEVKEKLNLLSSENQRLQTRLVQKQEEQNRLVTCMNQITTDMQRYELTRVPTIVLEGPLLVAYKNKINLSREKTEQLEMNIGFLNSLDYLGKWRERQDVIEALEQEIMLLTVRIQTLSAETTHMKQLDFEHTNETSAQKLDAKLVVCLPQHETQKTKVRGQLEDLYLNQSAIQQQHDRLRELQTQMGESSQLLAVRAGVLADLMQKEGIPTLEELERLIDMQLIAKSRREMLNTQTELE